MIGFVTAFALAAIAVSTLMAFYRVIFGPTIPDRVVALDVVTVNVISAIVIYSVRVGTLAFIDSALVIAILSFISTVVMAKFIVKGEIVDRDGD